MDSKLQEVVKLIDKTIKLNNKALEGNAQLTVYTDSLVTDRFTIKLVKMKIAILFQRARIKKLIRLKNELIEHSKKESWAKIPGFKEYVKSVEDKFLPGRV